MQNPIIQNLISFLDTSPTAWHAIHSLLEQLKQVSFIVLDEQEPWYLEPEKRYVVTRNGSSLCAFITPKNLPKRVRLLASHTDSPALKLKPKSEFYKHKSILLGVEVYGSPLLSSWLNRDLGIAGRVTFTNHHGQIKQEIVCLDQSPVTIPQLAIHLDREINERGLQLNKQEHLNALAGLEKQLTDLSFIETLLREKIHFENLIDHDLFLFPLEKARLVGYQQTFLAAYRIDSLASVHAALHALLQNLNPLDDEIKMVIFWDNEEVGSHTSQGAESPFFSQTLERILESFDATKEDYFCLVNRSTCISIDLAHALHPNYADKHDANHHPFLGEGIVLKHNAQQRYATNACSALPIHLIAKEQNLSLQRFVSRNDMPCGSTIGPLQACSTGIPTVDIGCGQLSMHSCRELMSCQDHLDMCQLLDHLFKADQWPCVHN